MPQGERKGAAPVHEEYARKVDPTRRMTALGPRAAMTNPAFAAALPAMTRNIEQVAAAKLLRSGAIVHMGDIKRAGAAERSADAKAGAKRKRSAVGAMLGKGRNLKGVRGNFDAEELAELDPALRALLDHRKVTAGGSKKGEGTGGAGAGTGDGGVSGAAGGAVMRAPVGGGGGGGGRAKAAAGGGARRVEALEGHAGTGSGSGGLFAGDEAVAAAFGKDFL